MTSSTERVRRLRAKRAGLSYTPRQLSDSFRKGRWLDQCFRLAWVRFSSTDKFAQHFLRAHDSHAEDFEAKDSPIIDYCILVERSGMILIVPVEVKNWSVPQWLDAKRFEEKIGKKFKWFGEIEANIRDHWIPSFNFPGEDRAWELSKFKRINLLILTKAVQFTEEIADKVYANYRVERVDPIEPVSSQAQWKEIEERVVAQIVAILERVFYG